MKFLLCLLVVFLCAASVEAAPLLKVAAVQMRSSPELGKNIQKITDFLQSLSREGVQIAVFPECALTSYNESVIKATTPAGLAAALDAVGAACRKHKIGAVVGTPLFRPDGKLWNSAVVFDPNGCVIERFHKVHLAESWPEPGDHLALFDIVGVKATVIICHDERYPELVRIPAIAGARLVFYISSESGLTAESKINPYRAQIQARAVENCVWVVHANVPANEDASGSHGQSRIIKPDGNITAEATMFGEETVTATIDIGSATGDWATASLNCEFLRAFWETGLKALNKK